METPQPPPEDHSFTPANHKLISLYLRRRLAGDPLPAATAAHFYDADIYAAEPSALTEGLQPVPAGKGEADFWLFFTPLRSKSSTDSRRSRRVGCGLGTWHSEHAPEDVVDDEGNIVGHRQLFSYKEKGGRRSGWSMWEFGAAGQEGGESVLVLCKIHQARTASRRADGSAARSARKRKAAGDCIDQAASAPVRRRLFAPPAPTLPTVSEDKIGSASEAPIPCSRTETEASKDTPRSVLSFWEQATPEDMISAPLRPICSFSPKSEASREITTTIDASHEISTTMEPPASFLIPQPDALQGETAASDCGFQMVRGPAPPLEYCYHESFKVDDSGDHMSGLPFCTPGADISGSLTGYDTTASFSGSNPFLGDLPLYSQCGAGSSGSWNGYNTTASWSASNGILDGLLTYDEWGVISPSAGVQYGCGLPDAAFLPSAPSQWCGGPSAWSC